MAIKEFEESHADAAKLAELKAELEHINRKKAEYVEEHPEQRRLVYRRRKEGEPEIELPVLKKRNLFKKNGLPRHPERSIYYDPVMNPFGVAPPGMPYVERRECMLKIKNWHYFSNFSHQLSSRMKLIVMMKWKMVSICIIYHFHFF